MRTFIGAGIVAGLVAVVALALPQAQAPRLPLFGYTIVKAYPHDPSAFTQGLEVVNGTFYEGTGLVGRSSIRRVKMDTGEVLQKRDVPLPHFGEGITLFGGRLLQLTWQSGVAFAYDQSTFKQLTTFNYSGEGWGLTHNQTQLFMSDGTEYLRILDPATFREVRRVRVTAVGQPVKNLNELEFMKGEVLANVWMTDYIARINPTTGVVSGYIDLRGLVSTRDVSPDAVLNGIAYDDKSDRLFVTGKLWPRIFEIKLAAK